LIERRFANLLGRFGAKDESTIGALGTRERFYDKAPNLQDFFGISWVRSILLKTDNL
jgi:hypothetical protein